MVSSDGAFAEHQLADGAIAPDSQDVADVALRIGVDEKDTGAPPGQACGEVEGGRRLADAPLHVHDRNLAHESVGIIRPADRYDDPGMRNILLGLLALGWLAGQATVDPDLVIYNARVFTGDPARLGGAIAIRGDRIVEVATPDEARGRSWKATRIIDAGGKLLIPGINDAHTHADPEPPMTPLEGPPAMEHDPSLEEITARIKVAVGKTPAQGWISGEIGATVITDPRATRAAFDPITGGHPLIRTSWTGHGTIVNTAALKALNIAADAKDPAGGFYGRAPDGTLTGLAHEYAGYTIRNRLSALASSPRRATFEQVRTAGRLARYDVVPGDDDRVGRGGCESRIGRREHSPAPDRLSRQRDAGMACASEAGAGFSTGHDVGNEVDPRRHARRTSDAAARAVQRRACGEGTAELSPRRCPDIPEFGACRPGAADVSRSGRRRDRSRSGCARGHRRRAVEAAPTAHRARRHVFARRRRSREATGRDRRAEPVAFHAAAEHDAAAWAGAPEADARWSRPSSSPAFRSRSDPTGR